jgi:type IV secretory pathway ATPase VirB11/archaellum biosynthesis ATPase
MFYLDKRLYTIVKRIYPARGPAAEPRAESKIGFGIETPQAHEEVERVGGMIPRSIARSGSDFVYLLGSGMNGIGPIEARQMSFAKSSVIEELSKEAGDVGMASFGRAREIAALEMYPHFDRERADYLSYLVAHDTVGYGPISVLLEDKGNLEEIEVNSPSAPISVYHVKYGRCPTNIRFSSESSFRHSINKLICDTDKELGEDSPIVDAQVADARIHAQLKPYALSGAIASIRLGRGKTVGLDYLVSRGTASPDVLAYVWLAMDSGRNIVIAGSPASGKTTLLSAIFSFIPRFEKAVTIEEDINELKARMEITNTIELYGSRYGGVTTREQVINALRMRPSRLIVGEVRGEETRELFASANLGIPFITTMHSSTGGMDLIKKLLIRPMSVESRSLSMLDVALYMRHADVSRRALSDVFEYRWLSRAETDRTEPEVGDGDAVEIASIVSGGKLDTGALQGSKVVDAYSRKSGLSKRLVLKEFDKRSSFLKEVCASGATSGEIAEKVQHYGW